MRVCSDCGNLATWLYMPESTLKHDPFYCDNCVPRGCDCQIVHVYEDELEGADLPTAEDLPFKWIKFGKIWKHIDTLGRDLPCCEYDYSEEGYEYNDEDENKIK